MGLSLGWGAAPLSFRTWRSHPLAQHLTHTTNIHTYVHISIHVHTYTYTYIHYKHTHLHAHHTLSPCSGTLAAYNSFSLSPLGPRSPTCRSPRPLTKPRPRTSWCTQSCCGGPWTTSPAEVRRPRQSAGRGAASLLVGAGGSETTGLCSQSPRLLEDRMGQGGALRALGCCAELRGRCWTQEKEPSSAIFSQEALAK